MSSFVDLKMDVLHRFLQRFTKKELHDGTDGWLVTFCVQKGRSTFAKYEFSRLKNPNRGESERSLIRVSKSGQILLTADGLRIYRVTHEKTQQKNQQNKLSVWVGVRQRGFSPKYWITKSKTNQIALMTCLLRSNPIYWSKQVLQLKLVAKQLVRLCTGCLKSDGL